MCLSFVQSIRASAGYRTEITLVKDSASIPLVNRIMRSVAVVSTYCSQYTMHSELQAHNEICKRTALGQQEQMRYGALDVGTRRENITSVAQLQRRQFIAS